MKEIKTSGAYSVGAGVWKGKTSVSALASQESTYIDFKTAFDVSESFSVALNAHIADYSGGDRLRVTSLVKVLHPFLLTHKLSLQRLCHGVCV